MKDFLFYLVQAIVDDPEKVSVDESFDSATSTSTLIIHVSPADAGKVIGKGGRIIRAIRDLVRILAIKANTRLVVTLAED